MPLPLIVSLGTSALAIGSKIGKHYGKVSGTPLGQAGQFGLAYGALTNVGYNISNEGLTKNWRNTYKSNYSKTVSLPGYGQRYNQRSYRKKKFSFTPTRWFNSRVYNNKYRKYVYIHRNYRRSY